MSFPFLYELLPSYNRHLGSLKVLDQPAHFADKQASLFIDKITAFIDTHMNFSHSLLSSGMKAKIKALIYSSLGISLFLGPIRNLLDSSDPALKFLEILNAKTLATILSGSFCFSIYAVVSYLVFFKLYQKRKNIDIFLILIALSFPIILLRYLIQEVSFDYFFGFTNYWRGVGLGYYITDNTFYAIMYYGIGIAFFFFQFSLYSQKQKQEAELQNKKSELDFLRSQVNPHFLFNVFNNLYALVNKKSDLALPVLDKLTAMLRYSLYEKRQRVSLETELNYINDFIELEQLRYAKTFTIDKQINIDATEAEIAPFLLIPFIENAFKHGDLNDETAPLRISLRQDKATLCLEVENKKSAKKKDALGGIGLENTKKRLALLYPNAHELRISETDQSFKVELHLELNA